MSSSSSSSSKSLPRYCKCDIPQLLVKRTSWKPSNPGRRFLTCPHPSWSGDQCEAFYWIDTEPLSEWYKSLLNHMYMQLNPSERRGIQVEMNNQERIALLEYELQLYHEKMDQEVGICKSKIAF
ncbi:DNA-(apurinic or apyrimidinic site) lyase 2 [Tanacetum coccineum]